jgi:signal transduction histidine kinase
VRAARGKSPWLLDAVVVVVGLLTVTLLVSSMRLTSTTLDRNRAWDQAIGSLKVSMGLSYVWLEAAIAGDERIDVRRQVYANIDAAQARCGELLAGRHPVEGARARGAGRRLQTPGRAGSGQDRSYEDAFNSTLRLADEAQHSIALEIAGKRTALNRVNAGIVLLVLLVFAGMAVVVTRRAKQLAAHNERLRRLDRLKDDFVAAVSHELRTPLASTIGFLQTLERPDLELGEERRSELLTIARVQAQRLAGLVEDLLFFAQAETGKLRLRRSEVDVAALSADCLRAAEALAREKGISLRLTAEPVPPLRADRARLAQLLDNLVSNALKFTPGGGRVEVRARASDGRALLEVSDTGMGISPSDQAHLFDRFFRASAAVDQAIPGTGLGLAIVKAIVDAHSGVVTVTSEEARGTTVRVELPLSA